jgi:hypothetical protein
MGSTTPIGHSGVAKRNYDHQTHPYHRVGDESISWSSGMRVKGFNSKEGSSTPPSSHDGWKMS